MASKIIVADASIPEQKMISDILRKAGHLVVAETNDMSHTFRRARTLFCDLVIIDCALEGGGIKTASIINEDRLAAVLLLVDSDSFSLARRFHYLLRPIYSHTLIPAVEAALFYWRRETELQNQIKNLEDKLQTRKLLDKAKGILMDRFHIKEAEAYRLIQKEAMNRGVTLKLIATDIITKYKS